MAIEAAVAAASALGVAGLLGAWCDGRGRRAARQSILAPCRDLLDDAAAGVAPDGFPRLSGRADGRRVRLSLVPDTLAPRRLPQLWLAFAASTPVRFASLVLTARPRCEDHVGRPGERLRLLDVPDWLPQDFAVRGDDAAADWLAALRRPLGDAFADPLVKELAFAPGRVDVLYRLAEGRRGAHLLLRQATFDASLDRDRLRWLLGLVAGLEGAARRGGIAG